MSIPPKAFPNAPGVKNEFVISGVPHVPNKTKLACWLYSFQMVINYFEAHHIYRKNLGKAKQQVESSIRQINETESQGIAGGFESRARLYGFKETFLQDSTPESLALTLHVYGPLIYHWRMREHIVVLTGVLKNGYIYYQDPDVIGTVTKDKYCKIERSRIFSNGVISVWYLP